MSSLKQRPLLAMVAIAELAALPSVSSAQAIPMINRQASEEIQRESEDLALLQTPEPSAWLPNAQRCRTRSRRQRKRFCDGPRRVARPYGMDAFIAKRLGLGEGTTASHLLIKGPKEAWQLAAASVPENEQEASDLVWPVDDGKLLRGLQRARGRRGPRRFGHKGVDIGAPEGTPFRAVRAGIVAYADNGVRGYGNLVLLLHPDGAVSFYAHAKAIYVFAGQRVLKGQVLGEIGDTGIARGAHLHFEWRRDGKALDPMPLFQTDTATSSEQQDAES